MLNSLGPDIWFSDGPVVDGMAGFHYPTRMAVIGLSSGELLVWSPIALDPALKAAVDALGRVAHLMAPNALHHLSLADWQAAYPRARLHAVPALAAKRPDLRIDATLGGRADPAWADVMDHHMIETRITSEVVLLHRDSGTVIFTDLLQQLPPDWFTGWRGLVARLDLMTADAPQVPRKFRMAIQDKAATRRAIDALLESGPSTLLMAHGPVVRDNAQTVLRDAFQWLR